MRFRGLFLRLLTTTIFLGILTANITAQTESRPRRTTTAIADETGATRLETDPVVISVAPVAEAKAGASTAVANPRLALTNQMLLAAIELRLGTPYRLGASGPDRYDCSGFVWSVFQSAGINFERASAYDFWTQFAPATEEEKKQFGTLVFFNNQKHIGIVADAYGFYHASTSQGVTYSLFSGYWGERIDGFRRVPLPQLKDAAPDEEISGN